MLCGNEEEKRGREAKTRRASVPPATRISGWRDGAVARSVERPTGRQTDDTLNMHVTQVRLCVGLVVAAVLAFLFLPKGAREQKRQRTRASRPKSESKSSSARPPPPAGSKR
jgi:hypothetical protein